MIIYPELKKIAGALLKIKRLVEILETKTDLEGLDLYSAYLIDGCKEIKGHLYQDDCRLDNSGIVDDEYYCCQYTGYLEDDFYGTVYYKTNVPGQFVAIPFSM